MKPARDYLDYLEDMVGAAREVEEFTRGFTYERFTQDMRTVRAVIASLQIIGEAATHVPPEMRRLHPEAPWQQMIGMRNRLVHAYFAVDLAVVWETATVFVPILRPQVERVLESEDRRRDEDD